MVASFVCLMAVCALTVNGNPGRHRGWAPVWLAVGCLVCVWGLLRVFAPHRLPWGLDKGDELLLILCALIAAASILALKAAGSRQVRAEPPTGIVQDPLTRTASHRAFQDRLAHECERAYRFGESFTLLIVDIDQFRATNDRFGYRVGDQVLAELADHLREWVRSIDLCARFGGDQFALILPHTFQRGGVEIAERIRKNVAGWSFRTPRNGDLRLTVSLGMASYPRDGDSAAQLVDAATYAVLFAKTLGGNQAQTYSKLPPRTEAEGQPRAGVYTPNTIVRSLAAAVDVRDRYTHSHSRVVSALAAAIGRELHLSTTEVGRVTIGGLLHDVGKIGVPDAILTKQGALTEEEWHSIKQHPVLGKRVIEQAPELRDVVPLVLHHQERYDGTGYPFRLKAEEIPLGARIIAAADAYHAIRSDRPYRSGRTHAEAVPEMLRCAGTQFDPKVINALLRALEADDNLRSMMISPLPAAPSSALASDSTGALN
ncbi:MAG: diguanylate cyclase [Gaiellales bacterium]|nr:diguanylate cyclase [Gaiellales bacterium]